MNKKNKNDLLLGWPTRFESFDKKHFNNIPENLSEYRKKDISYAIKYSGDSHLITFAPTGSGKGVSVIIPNLLHYSGPIIVVDPKGENFAVTAKYRQSLGQKVLLLDPFEAVSDQLLDKYDVSRGSLNPLDLAKLSHTSIDNDAQMISNLLSGGGSIIGDPFWDITGISLLTGLVAHEMYRSKELKRPANFSKVIDILYADDPVYSMAVMLDTERPHKFVQRKISSSFLSIPAKETKAGILATAQSYLATIMSGDLLKYLNESTISLQEIQDGEQYTLYIVIPPNKLDSHSFLLKTWIGVLMHSIMERKKLPEERTLFMLDECANLGHMDSLRKAVTLLRGYGLQVWMFFQDLSQMQMLYTEDFRTMINNCGVLQTFGISRKSASDPLASIIGTYRGTEILSLDKTQQILSMAPNKVRTSRLMKYYIDNVFQGLYDNNPLITIKKNEINSKNRGWSKRHRHNSNFS